MWPNKMHEGVVSYTTATHIAKENYIIFVIYLIPRSI